MLYIKCILLLRVIVLFFISKLPKPLMSCTGCTDIILQVSEDGQLSDLEEVREILSCPGVRALLQVKYLLNTIIILPPNVCCICDWSGPWRGGTRGVWGRGCEGHSTIKVKTQTTHVLSSLYMWTDEGHTYWTSGIVQLLLAYSTYNLLNIGNGNWLLKNWWIEYSFSPVLWTWQSARTMWRDLMENVPLWV